MEPDALEPRHHDPPAGWPVEVFEAVTSALAAALVAVVKRERDAARAELAQVVDEVAR
jgi:hypothetical protein